MHKKVRDAIAAKGLKRSRIELLDAPSETNGRRGADIRITLPRVDGATGDTDDASTPATAPQPVM